MEVCGTHTVAVFRHGIRSLLPSNVKLISGPGCPVCVTSQEFIDGAVALCHRERITLATFGDMMRVPGASGSLEQARADGARVEVVLSVRDAVGLARANPEREVVFLAVGFETTAPSTAEAILLAGREGVENFTVLQAHKMVVPAMMALLAAGQVRIDGFLCPGHVSVMTGSEAYRPLVERFGKGCVVAGFEPEQIISSLARLAEMVAVNRPELENNYTAVVTAEGNRRALDLMDRVFEPVEVNWRGLGQIGKSGLGLRQEYRRFDAAERFDLTFEESPEPPGCRCGDVIRGVIDPPECSLFGRSCRPSNPVGACMVSSEGTCQAWWKHRRPAVRNT
jgi:hydrogenase expression/formation protein HypD